MTIICAKDGVIAADGSVWMDELTFSTRKKIRQLGDGALVGAAGDAEYADAFMLWKQGKCGKPDVPPDDSNFAAIEINKEGIFQYAGNYTRFSDIAPFAAIGSHAEFAMGLMDAGMSAEQAVWRCIERGAWARGPVQVERVEGWVDKVSDRRDVGAGGQGCGQPWLDPVGGVQVRDRG